MSILKKHISLAVLGAPSSGKSYLLSDLIQSFSEMGYVNQELPLTTPYSSIGSFFFETTSADDGMRQTEVFVCRQENHYCGIFKHPKLPIEVEVDFLNIAGETFGNNASHMKMFNELKQGIQNIKVKQFALVTYTNPAGRERYILEPARELVAKGTVPFSTAPCAYEIDQYYRRYNFLDSGEVYAELKNEGYKRGKVKAINGKTLLDRYFEIMPDSVISTLTLMWNMLFPNLNRYTYDANHIFHYFYPLLYCTRATDIVVCDRLFASSEDDELLDQSYPFHFFVGQVCSLMESKDINPNVYLAFRGTDFMLAKKEKNYKELMEKCAGSDRHTMRNHLYTVFCKALLNVLDENTTSDDELDYDNYIDTTPGVPTLTGMDIDQHLRTRMGSDQGHGFWHLMNQAEGQGIICLLKRMFNGQKTVKELFTMTGRPVFPPHVYFTSTPIDVNFNIYVNDKTDYTRFVHKGKENVKFFHIENACNGVPSMCWGSYQLLDDILTQNGLNIFAKNKDKSLLNYLKNI